MQPNGSNRLIRTDCQVSTVQSQGFARILEILLHINLLHQVVCKDNFRPPQSILYSSPTIPHLLSRRDDLVMSEVAITQQIYFWSEHVSCYIVLGAMKNHVDNVNDSIAATWVTDRPFLTINLDAKPLSYLQLANKVSN